MVWDGSAFGVIYHTVKQGNNQEPIFRSDEDRQMYLSLLRRYKKRLRFRLYGYVLLPDHVHLLLEPGPVELPRIMHSLHSAYARYFNKVYQRSGHLFQGRYTSGPCTRGNNSGNSCAGSTIIPSAPAWWRQWRPIPGAAMGNICRPGRRIWWTGK